MDDEKGSKKFMPDTGASKEAQALAEAIFTVTKGKPVKTVDKALSIVRDEVYRMTEPEGCGMINMSMSDSISKKLKKALKPSKKGK